MSQTNATSTIFLRPARIPCIDNGCFVHTDRLPELEDWAMQDDWLTQRV